MCILNFVKICPAVFETRRSQDFLQKIKKPYQINNLEFRKKNPKKHFRNSICVYTAHVKFQKVSFNSN